MLKHWEQKLLRSVLDDPEMYINKMGYVEWQFPDYMTETDKCDMVLDYAYFNDNGKEIQEKYEGNIESYLVHNLFLDNFEVLSYLTKRLEKEGII